MSQDQENFPELNLSELNQQALKWAEQFPCIQDISLYKASYINPTKNNHIIVISALPLSELSEKEKKEVGEVYNKSIGLDENLAIIDKRFNNIESLELRQKLRNNFFHKYGCYYIQKKIQKNNRKKGDLYQDPSKGIDSEWLVIPVDFDNPITAYSRLEGIVDGDSKEPLYENPSALKTKALEEKKLQQESDDFVKDAKRSGYLNKIQLAFVLGCDGQYSSKDLCRLWSKVELNMQSSINPKGDRVREKIVAWNKIIERLTTGCDARGFRSQRLNREPLKHYIHNSQKMEYFVIDADKEGGHYIKIENLRFYFPDVLDLPIPQELFPKKLALSANTSQNIETQLNDDLLSICPELEKFYRALVEEVDLSDYGAENSINKIGVPELYKIALDYFDRTQNEYKVIKKTLVEKENLYTFSGNRRRMFIRNILQEYLKDHPAMNNNKIHTSKEALHSRYNKVNGLT
jgi:hypothetical protein